MGKEVNLTESLNELQTIVDWFDEQQEVDVEEGLNKVREAAGLIKSSKVRLTEIENEFQLIEKDIAGDDPEEEVEEEPIVEREEDVKPIDVREIPF